MQNANMRTNWFLLGDIHGQAAPIEYFYKFNNERLNLDTFQNNLILLGDVGCNFSIIGKGDEYCKQSLSRFPFTYICLRGNHEARVTDVVKLFPDKWEQREKYGGIIYVEKEYPRIEYLEDIPAVYEFGEYKTLSIPGAYSIDKQLRIQNNWGWFENEQLSDSEMEIGRNLIEKYPIMDLVISHTCPITFEPRDLFLKSFDQAKVDKRMEIYLGEIEAKLDYKRWAWGHFHADRLYPWDGDKEKLMLFDENVVDLNKFMTMKRTDSLFDIIA